MDIKFKIKNMEALKEFAKFYDEYEILDYDNENIIDEKSDESVVFNKNLKLLEKAFTPLSILAKEADETETGSTTPTTFVIFQVVAHKLVTKERYDEVLLNLKSWQDIARGGEGIPTILKLLSFFTGYK